MTDAPGLSVVIVSDYEAPGHDAHDDLRRTLGALAAQPGFDEVECIIVESREKRESRPAAFPGARVAALTATSSYALKNAGVKLASRRHVALLDADCTPAPDWLQAALGVCRDHPTAAVTSGRTRYQGRTATERCLGLLSRSYVEGAAGTTRHISNNNAVYRRDWFLAHPLPEDATPFSSSLQSSAMLAAGAELRFEPELLVTHAFEGWKMERDIRRNLGFSVIKNRMLDPGLPHARWLRLGALAPLAFTAGRLLKGWGQSVRHGASYGVRWHEQPVAFGLALVVTAFELEGMVLAVSGRPLGPTAYR